MEARSEGRRTEDQERMKTTTATKHQHHARLECLDELKKAEETTDTRGKSSLLANEEAEDVAQGGGGGGPITIGQDYENMEAFFRESKDVLQLVDKFAEQHRTSHIQICKILDKYQEQGELLDPYLSKIVTPLMEIVTSLIADKKLQVSRTDDEKEEQIGIGHNSSSSSKSREIEVIDHVFSVIYTLTKVRGLKTISRLMPHRVQDLEPALQLLIEEEKSVEWKTPYCVLIWLSVSVLIPFDLNSVESGSGVKEKGYLIAELIRVVTSFLGDPGTKRDVAALVLSKLFSRPEMKHRLQAFLADSCTTLGRISEEEFLTTGLLKAMCNIYVHCDRTFLAESESTKFILDFLLAKRSKKRGSIQTRKLFIKLLQRIALVYLKPRASRIVLKEMKVYDEDSVQHDEKDGSFGAEDEEEDWECHPEFEEQIEEVLETLLGSLGDQNTVVRWSAAKGIGRICDRLPAAYTDDVISELFELFSLNSVLPESRGSDLSIYAKISFNSCHGGCLALAELVRRRLLGGYHLHTLSKIIVFALDFDVRLNTRSVGTDVRDAASYICWSLSRAYPPSLLKRLSPVLSTSLVTTAVFDRLVNVRRAASAAFQEQVGRTNLFPHGIDIIGKADYWTLANLTSCYTEIAPDIAKFSEYTRPILDHLLFFKVPHWDINLRNLASQSIQRITETAPDYVSQHILPQLLKDSLSTDSFRRHGSILSYAEALLQLKKSRPDDFNKNSCIQSAPELIVKIEKAKLCRGRGGEAVRIAMCRLIEVIALTEMKLPTDGNACTVSRLQETIDDNICHPNDGVENAAIRAFKAFSSAFYQNSTTSDKKRIVQTYLKIVRASPNVAATRGCTLALGVCHSSLLLTQLPEVVETLIWAAIPKANADEDDVETRRNAVIGLTGVVQACGATALFSTKQTSGNGTLFDAALTGFSNGLKDYSTDNRGDVGSWIRQVSGESFFCLLRSAAEADSKTISPDVVSQFVQQLLRLMTESLNSVRGCAGKVFEKLVLAQDPPIPHIPQHAHLIQLVKKLDLAEFDWSRGEETYSLLLPLLALPEYRLPLLCGVLSSLGGTTQSLIRITADALVSYIEELQEDGNEALVAEIAETILGILKNRFTLNVRTAYIYNALSVLFSNGCFDAVVDEKPEYGVELLEFVWRDVIDNPENIILLLHSVEVIVQILSFPNPTQQKALKAVFYLIGHPYPRVRKHTATRFYSKLLSIDPFLPDEQHEELLSMLAETIWDDDHRPALDPALKKLASLVNIE